MLIEINTLVDDVLVAAAEAEVAASESADVLRQTVARHRIRHHCAPRVLPTTGSEQSLTSRV